MKKLTIQNGEGVFSGEVSGSFKPAETLQVPAGKSSTRNSEVGTCASASISAAQRSKELVLGDDGTERARLRVPTPPGQLRVHGRRRGRRGAGARGEGVGVRCRVGIGHPAPLLARDGRCVENANLDAVERPALDVDLKHGLRAAPTSVCPTTPTASPSRSIRRSGAPAPRSCSA